MLTYWFFDVLFAQGPYCRWQKLVLLTKFFKIYVKTYECGSVHHSFTVK